MLRNGILEKFSIERQGDRHEVGAIFRGKIQNLEPGLKAAFVDIGQEKKCLSPLLGHFTIKQSIMIEVVKSNKSKKQLKKREALLKNIPDLYPVGSEILVQITKGQIGSKGPRVTHQYFSLPGRFLVLTPYGGTLGISRKIEDRAERTRLKKFSEVSHFPKAWG